MKIPHEHHAHYSHAAKQKASFIYYLLWHQLQQFLFTSQTVVVCCVVFVMLLLFQVTLVFVTAVLSYSFRDFLPCF